ncbi:thiosulfate oxidation carrier complex protein SoxZ [Rhodobacteraceae bacterium N5(2021)]|uniref:Thiosulfate oxidation carrier complex protein SoxZ n=1 Tax=Gymnodinialimonas phycosphaerae TaxID=2841589 RepID=A0A975YHJ5_9RHOB|nr:thiosulfate oxidation carrier complex protein SoxZ [Gymnodinialimonas phycosphaerae]MBY4892899.1 thiosulfate oxidation carrier complex protein SoxZ [Gymnodinialimonas phycosphaerae]
MADNVTPRVRVPREASAGDIVSVRSLISHVMESGQRRDGDGNIIPRSIINRFVCDFNGINVIDVTIEPSISTNPYFQFEAVVNETGTFNFTWYDDDGSIYEETADITVS